LSCYKSHLQMINSNHTFLNSSPYQWGVFYFYCNNIPYLATYILSTSFWNFKTEKQLKWHNPSLK